ncbi:MAG: amidohydrolase [Chloroflexi bacterium]|nr:amidohydrolase [Chloroflexota bacterium]GIW09754.1 MAG: hypothetical protein KatS3mg061_0811 [Dehalococcoidia bacterium]
MIIDAQVHLWEADRPDRPLDPAARPHLPEPMTAERMLALMDEAGVDRAVISPLYLPGNAPDYALEVTQRYPDRFRVMGWFQPTNPDHFARLPRWLDEPGMCSIRLSLNDPHGPRLLAEGALEPLWAGAERYGIPVAVFRLGGAAALMEPVVQRYPGLKLIIDHLNVPYPPEQREQRLGELEQLARFPNVWVKVSALPLFSTERPPFGDLQPLIQRVYAAFGAHRLLWGSDQTQQMARNLCRYSENVDIIRVEAARWMPADDVAWVLGKTAAALFQWP